MQDLLSDRFRIQEILPGMGRDGQEKLRVANVLVVGAGGLGCPALQYLVAAGIGTVGICDGDQVEESNLHRQVLFSCEDLGINKAILAAEKLRRVYGDTDINCYPFFIDGSKALEILPNYDIILDCSDRQSTRYLLSDAATLLQKPLVYAAVYRNEAQVAVLYPGPEWQGLRDIFHQPQVSDACTQSGILGMITGIAGSMQALECVRYLAGLPGLKPGELLHCDLKNYSFYKTKYLPRTGTAPEWSREEFLQRHRTDPCSKQVETKRELEVAAFAEKIRQPGVVVVDVRNEDELPLITEFKSINIPLKKLVEQPSLLPLGKPIVLFCHAGVRSLEALEFLEEQGDYPEVYHLKGGLLQWRSYETGK